MQANLDSMSLILPDLEIDLMLLREGLDISKVVRK